MDDLTLRQTIDACRPASTDRDSTDLDRPEFAELANLVASDRSTRRLFEASQVFDAALGEALHDVPVPPALAKRLLAATESLPTVPSAPLPSVSLPASNRARPWSEAMEWSVSLAAVLLVAVAMGAYVRFSSPGFITTDQLFERSVEWREQIDHGQWNENWKAAPRDEFPTGSHVAFAPWRWQRVKTADADLVVYYGGPPGAMLFVVRSKTPVQGLSTSPKLLSTTGGWSVGAWQAGDLTYVFVVEGDKRRYESHFKPSAAA